MAMVKAFVVHDETGRITSISRPAIDGNVTVLGGDGESVLEVEVEESSIANLVGGGRADIARKTVVS
ncbi:hypothetical protein [Allorhizocola rhizosphaerae]|uniref:hypothetical protein n=1 Tax=Allorhizocola rhizosphaerae TaxID=1872709 RepID=UPI0013C2E1D5|nr:hypothetical protein [Allorhizocola rhizosphaerae]